VFDSRWSWFVLVLVCALVWSGTRSELRAQEQSQSSYRLQTSVMGSAGSPGASGAKSAEGTMGQPTPLGVGSSSDKMLFAGFWSRPWELASVLDDLGPLVFKNCIFQNFPNPFMFRTTIVYTLAEQEQVEITIFNVEGRKVKTLVAEVGSPGRHVVDWNGKDVRGVEASPGVYFCRMRVGSYEAIKKMLVLR
jgi:hypothetical protein